MTATYETTTCLPALRQTADALLHSATIDRLACLFGKYAEPDALCGGFYVTEPQFPFEYVALETSGEERSDVAADYVTITLAPHADITLSDLESVLGASLPNSPLFDTDAPNSILFVWKAESRQDYVTGFVSLDGEAGPLAAVRKITFRRDTLDAAE